MFAVRVDAAGGGTIERSARLAYLGEEGGHACASGCIQGVRERSLRSCRPQRAQRHLGRGQFRDRPQRWRQALRIERGQGGCGLVEAAEQQQSAHQDQTRVQRIGTIGACLERGRRGRQRARRAEEVAHRQRHLRLRDHAAGVRHVLACAKAAGGAPQQLARARVVAELGQGGAAQGERWRVVAQGDTLEGTERVAGCERARGSGDQGIHRDRVPIKGAAIKGVGLFPGHGSVVADYFRMITTSRYSLGTTSECAPPTFWRSSSAPMSRVRLACRSGSSAAYTL